MGKKRLLWKDMVLSQREIKRYFASLYGRARTNTQKLQTLKNDLDVRLRYNLDDGMVKFVLKEIERIKTREAKKTIQRLQLPPEFERWLVAENYVIASAETDKEKIDVLYKLADWLDREYFPDSFVDAAMLGIEQLEKYITRRKPKAQVKALISKITIL